MLIVLVYYFPSEKLFILVFFMKIVQFLPRFQPYEWELSSLAWEFAKNFVGWNFWEVLNVVFVWNEKWVDWYEKDWYKVLILPSLSFGSHYMFKFWSKKFWRALSSIKEWSPDIIQTHWRSFMPTMFWLIFSLKLNKKWVYMSHKSWYKKWLPWWRLWATMLYDYTLWRLTFWFCNNIITLTNLSWRYIRSLTKKKIDVVYRGADFPSDIVKEQKNDLDTKLCFIWTLEKKSWIGVLIRAYAEYRKEHPNVRLSIIWDWPSRWDVEKLSEMLWIKDSVEILWKIPREEIKLNYMGKYDVLVVPTLESESLIQEVIVRWLLSKSVVVASDIWASKEITEKEDLVLVKVWDVVALSQWIETAIASLDKSGLSHDEVKEKFSWKKMLKEYLSICYP
jgi:glycosyltransferase involved in cell wall biosynthesis